MIDLSNTEWERVTGYYTEHSIDARWKLKGKYDQKPYGNLRIVNHPDIPPGHLRAIFTYIISIKEKSKEEQLKMIEDYEMNQMELEVYSVDSDIETETQEYEAPLNELEELFDVKIIE